MRLPFTKMQGLGNDFVVIDATRQRIELDPARVRALADRRFGVGCDQVLIVEPARSADTDFYYRIFNADGGEVENCGNGARCFARYVLDKGLTSSHILRVGTMRGVLSPQVLEDGRVRVEMGVPRFEPAEIPFLALRRAATYALQVGAQERAIAALSLGNPHAVQIVADVDTAPVAEEGPLIERHERFPQRVNAGFMQVLDRHAIRLRVYERGAGETLACGTGACAAVAAGVIWNLLDSPVRVETRGGALDIAWSGEGGEVVMSGAACSVFEGDIEIDRQAAACGHTEGAS
jgi:diaminopimelate epimerase